MIRRKTIGAAALLFAACPLQSVVADDGGGGSWLQLEYETSTVQPDGTESASSSSRQVLIETIIEETEAGTIIEYDWPRKKDGKAISNFWYFPAKVLEKPDGSLELLEREVIEARVEQWLQKYGISREACGYWTHGGGFPFRVDCDPDYIFRHIESFDLRIPNLIKGAEFSHGMGEAPGIFEPLAAPRTGLSVTVKPDTEISREAEAKIMLLHAQMTGEELTYEQAMEKVKNTQFSGYITIEFDMDEDGEVTRRTEVSEITIDRPGERPETEKAATTLERRDLEEMLAEYRK